MRGTGLRRGYISHLGSCNSPFHWRKKKKKNTVGDTNWQKKLCNPPGLVFSTRQRSTCNISGTAYAGKDAISAVKSGASTLASSEPLRMKRWWWKENLALKHFKGACDLEDSSLKGQEKCGCEHRPGGNLASPSSWAQIYFSQLTFLDFTCRCCTQEVFERKRFLERNCLRCSDQIKVRMSSNKLINNKHPHFILRSANVYYPLIEPDQVARQTQIQAARRSIPR